MNITTDDYFVTSNGAVYDAIQAAYIVLRIILPASACLPICTFVHVPVCASVQLEIHSLENTNKITDVRALTCTTFHFNCFILTVSILTSRKKRPI